MATFTYNGSASQTIAFNPAVDVLNFNVAPAQVRNVQQTSDGVVVTLASGAVLTLTGASYSSLRLARLRSSAPMVVRSRSRRPARR